MCRRVKWIRIMTFNGDQPELTAGRRLRGSSVVPWMRVSSVLQGPVHTCPRTSGGPSPPFPAGSALALSCTSPPAVAEMKPQCRHLSTSLSFPLNGWTFLGTKTLNVPNLQSEGDKRPLGASLEVSRRNRCCFNRF